MSPTNPTLGSDPALLSTLATLRLVLPSSLLLILAVRFATVAFLAMMDRIQAQGWVQEEDDMITPTSNPDAEGEVHPVVIRQTTLRKGLVLALFSITAMTYFADGVAQILSTLITNEYTPGLELYTNIIPYVVGSMAALSLCALAMTYEARASKVGAWGSIYPRFISIVAWAAEAAIMFILVLLIKNDPTNQPSSTPVPSIHLAILALRLLLLSFLILSQTPLLYKASFVAYSALHPSASERASLLQNGVATTYGSNGVEEGVPKKKGTIRSSRPPNSRPPDPKSLSLLTLFTRIKTLFPYLWPSKSFSLQVLAIICVALMLLKRFVNVGVPFLFGRIVGDLSAGRRESYSFHAQYTSRPDFSNAAPYLNIGLYVLASFLQDSNTMLYRYLWLSISQYSEREMSALSFDTLLNLSLSYHTKRKTGELLRILSRSDAINDFFETLIFTFLPILIDLPVAVLVLSVKYGGLIVTIVIGVSVIFVTTSVTLAESRTKLYRKLRDENQFMSQIKTDTLLNWETVKIFTAERFESDRLRTAMRVYQKGYFGVYSAWNSLSLIQDSISAFGLLVCSFILARRVINKEIDVGDFVTFVSYLGQLYRPLNSIAGLYRTVMSNLVDTEQLIDLLNEEKDVVDRPNAVDLVVGDGGIVFDNVKFSYDGKKETIKGISFAVRAGDSVALVGPSGGGKTSLFRLLYRFYDVSEGSIKIDGIDIRDLTQRSLRTAIGLVPQDSVLFNEAVKFNIQYGCLDSSDEEVFEAARAASIHDRIMTFPEQYETRVGERGQRLSGGEKQRVAIARVILKDPPILLLDEATSALDTTNERMIQQRLRELSKGRTTLSIAHRLSTITDCDVIHVLSEGVIAESGSHHELLAKQGLYAELWMKQSQAEADGTDSETKVNSGTSTPLNP